MNNKFKTQNIHDLYGKNIEKIIADANILISKLEGYDYLLNKVKVCKNILLNEESETIYIANATEIIKFFADFLNINNLSKTVFNEYGEVIGKCPVQRDPEELYDFFNNSVNGRNRK